jgi:hypothetical protein
MVYFDRSECQWAGSPQLYCTPNVIEMQQLLPCISPAKPLSKLIFSVNYIECPFRSFALIFPNVSIPLRLLKSGIAFFAHSFVEKEWTTKWGRKRTHNRTLTCCSLLDDLRPLIVYRSLRHGQGSTSPSSSFSSWTPSLLLNTAGCLGKVRYQRRQPLNSRPTPAGTHYTSLSLLLAASPPSTYFSYPRGRENHGSHSSYAVAQNRPSPCQPSLRRRTSMGSLSSQLNGAITSRLLLLS